MKKYIFVRQDDLKDCGICSLLMIIRTYKGECSKELLRNMTNTNKYGTSAYDIINTAIDFGFNSYGVSGGIQDINSLKLPVIAHLKIDDKYNHFVVIYNIDFKKEEITIADPASKIKKISFLEFKNISTNNYIVFEPKTKIRKINSFNLLYKLIKDIIFNNKILVLFTITLSILSAFGSCIISYFYKYIYDSLSLNYIFLFIFIILFIELISILKNYIIIKFNNIFDSCLYNDIYNRIISLPFIYFRNRTTGEVISRITDLGIVREKIEEFFTTIILDLFIILFTIILLFSINKFFVFIIFITMFLLVISYCIFYRKIKNSLNDLKNNNETIYNNFCNSIYGIETIRTLNLNDEFKKKFDFNYKDYIRTKNNYLKYIISNNFIVSIIIKYANIIIISLLILYVIKVKLNVSYLIIVSSLIGLLFNSFYEIINYVIDLINSKNSIDRLAFFYQYQEDSNIVKLDKSINNISINKLNYQYSYLSKKIRLSYNFNKEDKVLIKGISGVGKSTLARIIAGFINVDTDMIYINNVDINNVNKLSLLDRVNYIANNEFLFNDTIRNNIVFNRKIDTKYFYKILDILNLEEMLSENNLNLDSMVEENGFNLSAGQKQRIILARHLLKDSEVYIFDEALSNLDYNSEIKIVKELLSLFKNKIIIYITHRDNIDNLFNKKLLLE